jgi:hypothetical protein
VSTNAPQPYRPVRPAAVRPGLLPADSPLAVTAVELLATHVPAGDVCTRCAGAFPCASVRHAREVCIAADIDPNRAAQLGRAAQAARRAAELPGLDADPAGDLTGGAPGEGDAAAAGDGQRAATPVAA